jgi:hypothetical protein
MVTLLSWSPCWVALTTSWPWVTWPKTACLPCSRLVAMWLMKNWRRPKTFPSFLSWFKGGQSFQQQTFEAISVLAVVCSAVAVWTKPDHFPRVVRAFVRQALYVVGFKIRCPVSREKRSPGITAFAAPIGAAQDVQTNCRRSGSI